MKIRIILFLFLSNYCFSQVGINTENPDPSSILELDSNNSGLLIPRMTEAQINSIFQPARSLLVFNLDRNCLFINLGTSNNPAWECASFNNPNSVQVDCTTNGFQGSYQVNTTLTTSETFSVTVTNRTFSTISLSNSVSDVALSGTASSGVTITSVSPSSATLTAGQSQLITYQLSGTPTSNGRLTAEWNQLGLVCSRSISIGNVPVSLNFQNASRSIPEGNGTSTFTTTIELSQPIADNVDFQVDIAVNGSGNAISTPATRLLSIQSGATTVVTSFTVNGDFIDEPDENYTLTISNIFSSYSAGVVAGSPQSLTVTNDDALAPDEVRTATGRIWKDRNLGATRRATSSTDFQAYGSLYQWGRLSDGHEQITWNNPNQGIPSRGTTSTNSTTDVPPTDLFILETSVAGDWRDPRNNNLWQGVNGINNPCPAGFRIPTRAEWQAEIATWSANNSVGAFNSPLKLVLPGFRSRTDGTLQDISTSGYYWTSDVTGDRTNRLRISQNQASSFLDIAKSFGLCVRCIKD